MSSSKFSLSFMLKQHTPLIHFQHDQAGATLRATEVKAKLDRFILERLQQVAPAIYNEYHSVINPVNFPIDGKVRSNYKLRIRASNVQTITVKTFFTTRDRDSIPESERTIGSYFGEFKGTTSDQVTIEIFSFNSTLRQLVFEALKYFFLFETSGCRGSKGFGCFSWDTWSEADIDREIRNGTTLFSQIWRKENQNGSTDSLAKIHEGYQILKSGKNIPNNPNAYRKSKLFVEMCKTGIGWEKRWIKKHITKKSFELPDIVYYQNDPIRCGDMRNDWDDDKEKEYRYIRAVLGLADNHEYLIEDENGRQDKKRKLVIGITHKPTTGSNTEIIERYSSPMLYKVFGNKIYVLVSPVNSQIFNQRFEFIAKIKAEPSQVSLGHLFTPESTQFNLSNFLDRELTNLQYDKLV